MQQKERMIMLKKELIRLLRADEIECRVSAVCEKGLSLLLYKDARVDQKILDETFGPFGWKRSHQCIDGNLYCTVEIYDRESGQWIAKQDVGTTGYTEKEKSQASDSFKRACFNWGIGRELYTAPFIWIPADKAAIQSREGQNQEKRYYCNTRFSVSSIQFNEDREISALVIVNDKGQAVYAMKRSNDGETVGRCKEKDAGGHSHKGKAAQKELRQESSISGEQINLLQKELNRTGVTMETVQSRYKIQEPCAMSEELYNRVMSALKRTKSMEAT